MCKGCVFTGRGGALEFYRGRPCAGGRKGQTPLHIYWRWLRRQSKWLVYFKAAERQKRQNINDTCCVSTTAMVLRKNPASASTLWLGTASHATRLAPPATWRALRSPSKAPATRRELATRGNRQARLRRPPVAHEMGRRRNKVGHKRPWRRHRHTRPSRRRKKLDTTALARPPHAANGTHD